MQVNESVNASNFLAVGNQAGNSNRPNSEKSEQTDFASFLISSADASGKTSAGVKPQPDVKKTCFKENSVKDKTLDKNVSDLKEDALKKDLEAVKEPLHDDTVTTEHAKASEDVVEENGQELSSEETDALLEAAGTILQQVMEQFGLTAEELNQKLNEFGMETADLLSEDGLKNFFLSMKSAEVSDLIVDEGLNQEWNQFFDGVNEGMEQNGMNWDDLSAYAKEQETDNVLDYVSRIISRTAEDFVKKDAMNQPDGMEMPADPDEPIITVSDENPIKNQQNAPDSKMDENRDAHTSKEEHSTEDTSMEGKKNSHFENPVLQAVEQALDSVQDISFADEIPVSGKEVIDQIVEQVRVKMNQDTTSLEMQLYPEHLGKIQINVVSKDGVMTARIVAETEAAKQAIEGGLTSLKESMEQQNLKVDAIEVMVSTTGFESGNEEQNSYEQQQSSRSGKKLDLSELQEDEDGKEAAELEKMKYAGSSVSYTA